ncbi:MAG: superoxide dismutase, Fe-Mn family [Patescibacteria group bacterium]|nr:superoxide dismutase, Fe-Mn family [Patescibacteria group bacterium]
MFKLPELPYAQDALEPYISQKTLSYHYGKHHKAYIDNLNGLLEAEDGAKFKGMNVEEIVAKSSGKIFNNAAQAYNHTFYWYCMKPVAEDEVNEPSPQLKELLESKFGGVEEFKHKFTEVAKTHFGSGWAWLLKKQDGSIEIVGMHDADTPLMNGNTPLLALDVWEHAYYLDYQNSRPDYIEAFWKVVNWGFVESRVNGEELASLMEQV